MATLPLLLFPTPEKVRRARRFGGGKPLPRPTHDKQGRRLSPIFENLRKAIEAERINIQKTAAGDDPEKVLVIETVGNPANFVRAVGKIEDLKWMGELADGIVADNVFYDKDDEKKEISGRLYLVMTNQQGVDDLISLWNKFCKDEDVKFDRGLTPFREVFRYLNKIRYWGVEDRIEETGLLAAWKEDLKHDKEGFVRAEVELWFRSKKEQRQNSQEQVERFIKQSGGEVTGSPVVIEEIGYHAVLTEIPRKIAAEIIAHPKVGLLECDRVMFFSPVGQTMTDEYSLTDDVFTHAPPNTNLPKGAPVVGILDGMPFTNHEQLDKRVRVDDPDGYAAECPAEKRTHGTSMASLIIHGDLSDEKDKETLSHPVYMRPIMKPSGKKEGVPQNQLLVDLIHRAVVRMLKGEGESAAVAPNVKIINLSIGLYNRPFLRAMSSLARLLDWLSCEHGVLFVISTGNHPQEIKIDKSRAEFDALTDDEKEKMFVRRFFDEERHRRIFSPAESINGITVGALHEDATEVPTPPNQVELFNIKSRLPSPISAFGGGYRKSIKPDLIFNGGRVCYGDPVLANAPLIFGVVDYIAPPGNKSASPHRSGAQNRCAYSYGTSNATALISRMGAKCYDALFEAIKEQALEENISDNIAPLIKAMIVHGCSWGEVGDHLKSILEGDGNGRQIKNKIGRWLGYGVPDNERVLRCTEQRATLLGLGQLEEDAADLFTLPLPPSLGGRRGLRRVTITLAWLSPIKSSTQAYRTANLWFEIEKEGIDLHVKRQNADWNAVRRGTVQHELFEGERAVAIIEGDNLKIKVNCCKDATKIINPVHYGLVVTFEVADEIDVPVYQEINARIRVAG